MKSIEIGPDTIDRRVSVIVGIMPLAAGHGREHFLFLVIVEARPEQFASLSTGYEVEEGVGQVLSGQSKVSQSTNLSNLTFNCSISSSSPLLTTSDQAGNLGTVLRMFFSLLRLASSNMLLRGDRMWNWCP